MKSWRFASCTMVLAAALGACFGDNQSPPPFDASFPVPDHAAVEAAPPPETGPDATIDSPAETGPLADATLDVAPEALVESAVEAAPVDAAPEANPPEAGLDATADVAIDAPLPEAGPDAFRCTQTTDCPAGTACDTSSGQCGTACGDTRYTVCNGGCCSAATSGTCQPGTAGAACGSAALCVDCTGLRTGSACLGAGGCGCSGPTDCPSGFACDPSRHTCSVTCIAGTSLCNGGCCDPALGQCASGTTNGFCGTGGVACAPCVNGTPTCTAGVCTATCGAAGDGTCGGGTCCASNGTCQTQGTASACGAGCADCVGNAAGQACVGGTTCGCTQASDCLPYYTCNIRTRQCARICGSVPYTACNGGCCPPVAGAPSTCQTGTANNACGTNGLTCSSCVLPATCSAGGTCQ